MMLWKGPNGPETCLTCILHNSKAYWPTLGPFRHPQGVPKGSIWPKTEPTWPKLTCGPYDALKGSKWP
jgi:hypothetical protein